MAKILTFRPADIDRSKSGLEARTTASAEVIVFPGVRYEHWDDANGESTGTRRKQGQRRDVLDLAE